VAVEVRVPTMMRADTGGQASVPAEGGTIGEVVDDLVSRFPALAGKLRSDDGGLHKFVNVYVNDDDVRYLDKLDTKINDGDVISILPAVAGGQ
jgi:sulfur-carrier protein